MALHFSVVIDEATRYVVAPAGTAAKDLGNRDLIEDLEQARMRATAQGLAVYAVTVTVTQIMRL